jgi:hypothetical protein
LQSAARDVTEFVRHACRKSTDADGALQEAAGALSSEREREQYFYGKVLEHAMIDFGARVLYPSHPMSEEEDIVALYAEPREEVEAQTLLSYREYMRVLDCVMLHRDYELHWRSYSGRPALLQEFLNGPAGTLDLLAQYLGKLLSGDLYRAYLRGRFSRRDARGLFFRKLSLGGEKEFYFLTAGKVRRRTEFLAA